MSYNIKLDVFEGPLDLLLFFIKRDEINIYDIPIAHVTSEFLDYIHMAQQMNIHLAGEFLEMAGILMRIKSKMLLPDKNNQDGEDVEDPRTDLVNMLLEYRKYKEISKRFENREKFATRHYPAKVENNSDREYDLDLFLSEVTLFELSSLFKKLLQNKPEPQYYEIEKIDISIQEQRIYIMNRLEENKRIGFWELSKGLDNKLEVIVTFLAILEMVKVNTIKLQQNDVFEEIYLAKRDGEEHIAPRA
ncbi:MAG: segregation/condensation protein A [Candidatus Marinimicrobia bacterium]|nr:segregation/condensation protein A [Candidatus Neomarinimicrobiota bacterium]